MKTIFMFPVFMAVPLYSMIETAGHENVLDALERTHTDGVTITYHDDKDCKDCSVKVYDAATIDSAQLSRDNIHTIDVVVQADAPKQAGAQKIDAKLEAQTPEELSYCTRLVTCLKKIFCCCNRPRARSNDNAPTCITIKRAFYVVFKHEWVRVTVALILPIGFLLTSSYISYWALQNIPALINDEFYSKLLFWLMSGFAGIPIVFSHMGFTKLLGHQEGPPERCFCNCNIKTLNRVLISVPIGYFLGLIHAINQGQNIVEFGLYFEGLTTILLCCEIASREYPDFLLKPVPTFGNELFRYPFRALYKTLSDSVEHIERSAPIR